MAYASVEDVEQASGRHLTDTEIVKVGDWLDDAAYLIDGYVRWTVTDALAKRVSIRMVLRALESSGIVPLGATSGTDQAGPFAHTVTYQPDTASGGVWLSSVDKTMLRGTSRSGFASLPVGSERYEPAEDES